MGIFTLAAATLMLEILLTRIVSVVAWYHLAFFVISLTMLGMTAGALLVFLRPHGDPLARRMSRASGWFAALTPLCTWLALSTPLMPVRDLMDFAGLLLWAGLMALPFGCAGVAITLGLTRAPLPPARTYAADLLGAAVGCAAVIGLLEVLDAPSAIVCCAGLGGLAAAMFASAGGLRWRRHAALATGLLTLGVLNGSMTPQPLRPVWVKGVREDPAAFAHTAWNTHSRVTVSQAVPLPPMVWARGRLAPREPFDPIPQRQILIDGAAATFLTVGGGDVAAHSWIDWDISAFAHRLRPHGPAAVIGVGGGRDVIAAARSGHAPIVGVELNEEIVALHTSTFRGESGLANLRQVELHAAEARRFLAEETRRFSVITMSLIDTWASTGAGAYSLSESGLYTREAWETALSRLDDDGIFTISRWYLPVAPGETARMLALALETLYARDVDEPRDHVILLQGESVATLLMSPRPFASKDLDAMQKEAVRQGINMVATPRKAPATGLLAQLWAQEDRASLARWTGAQELDLTAPTDDRPFFFQMLKPSTWLSRRGDFETLDLPILGNLHATQTLVWATVASALLAALVIVLPLVIARRRRLIEVDDAKTAGLYFTLIGLGFMFVEIGLLSRLGVLLGDPVLALAALLGGIILGTGLGSLVSERFSLQRGRAASWLFPVVPVTLVVAVNLASSSLLPEHLAGGRLALCAALAFAPGLGLGICFPLGLRLANAHGERVSLGPWLWGINGAAGVCASSLALGCSMIWGISATLWVGTACYIALIPVSRRLLRRV